MILDFKSDDQQYAAFARDGRFLGLFVFGEIPENAEFVTEAFVPVFKEEEKEDVSEPVRQDVDRNPS